MNQALQNITIDKSLSPGAYNAVNVCLKLKKHERVTLITDNDTLEIAASLLKEINAIGSENNLFVLENFSPRPIKKMPEQIIEDLKKSSVSIYAASARPGELKSRIEMTAVVNKYKLRHAHMVNITKQIMLEGMRADYLKVDELSSRLISKARRTKTIRALSKGGTDITAEFSPRLKWLKTSGIISVEKWGNLPGGEIFTSPASVNGTFVVDGVVGDYLCRKYGDLKENPLTIEISDSRIKHLECSNKELLDEFIAYTMTDDNSNRVGEFAVGTNISLQQVIGNILQDEKLPGIHIAFGHPYAEHTGADWKSTTHIDCVGTRFDIWFDNDQIMSNGKFLI